jgi:hypothetical protein
VSDILIVTWDAGGAVAPAVGSGVESAMRIGCGRFRGGDGSDEVL